MALLAKTCIGRLPLFQTRKPRQRIDSFSNTKKFSFSPSYGQQAPQSTYGGGYGTAYGGAAGYPATGGYNSGYNSGGYGGVGILCL